MMKRWILRWLGLADVRRDLDAHTVVAQQVMEQLNRTTIGAADTMRRLAYYEEHVESLRYAHGRLKAKAAGANVESRIISLGDRS